MEIRTTRFALSCLLHKTKRMIENPLVIEQTFIPAEIQHRDAETGHLSNNLRPITDGNRAGTSFLFDPSGAGKTCVAMFTVSQLAKTVHKVETQCVNCWENHRRFQTPLTRPRRRGIDAGLHRQSTPTDVLLHLLTSTIASKAGSPTAAACASHSTA